MSNKERKVQDEELVALAQKGDKQAMESLLCRYSDLVKGCARRFFLMGGETDDLVQEGMVGLYMAVTDYNADEYQNTFKTFALTCVKRRIIDAVKRAASKKNSPLNDGISVTAVDGWLIYSKFDPEAAVISDDESKELKQQMMKTLSDFEYRVLSLYMDGMSIAEICDATGKKEKSVSNAIQRSKTKLQEVLKNK